MLDRQAMLRVLSEKYAVSALVYIYELSLSGPVTKYDLLAVIGSGNTIDNLVRKLEAAGLVKVKQTNIPRKTIYLTLTFDGRFVTLHLSKAVGSPRLLNPDGD